MMNANALCYLSAAQLGRLIQRREVSPVEVIEAHIKRIESLESKLNSFISFLPEQAREEAQRAEEDTRDLSTAFPSD
jgi:Asp-tRNA(Asn)/Glu-tRNA(Gln) amidotransferase A subunit family amidase